MLELTKLEMKEQLELLDFQMVEIENQKAMVCSITVQCSQLFFKPVKDKFKASTLNFEGWIDKRLFQRTLYLCYF